jgi:oxidase EvaA
LIKTIHKDLLKSAQQVEGCVVSTSEVLQWLAALNKEMSVKVSKVDFGSLKDWSFDEHKTILAHKNQNFFSIEGISVSTNSGAIQTWDQPIIVQKEIGFLGFIAKEIKGVLYFLIQAKVEPGNINLIQLSPTLQATRSNYTQAHKGKKPAYLDYFLRAKPDQILIDQLQSEQGARFLQKRNRNIVIKVDEEIDVIDGFVWLTLGQIKELMKENNLVNMDTRTVISGLSFCEIEFCNINLNYFEGGSDQTSSLSSIFLKSAFSTAGSFLSTEEVLMFLTSLKSQFDLEVTKIPLCELRSWIIADNQIYHREDKYFKVIGVDVEIGSREVASWSQPMVQPAQEGICAFVCKEINGILHFAVQAKLECGNLDVIEFAPTVQCLTGSYKKSGAGAVPFLDYVLNANQEMIYFDTYQSEEGGRFYKEQNRNMIVVGGEGLSTDLPSNYIWLTLNQLNIFLKFNNFLNIQARSLIAAIRYS